MVWLLVVTAAIVVGAGFWAAKQRRETVAPIFRPSLRAWRLLRTLLLLPIAWGFWISGRPSLQLLAALILLFFGVYVAIERPFKRTVNETPSTDRP